jgi:paraquat-inducible protein B
MDSIHPEAVVKAKVGRSRGFSPVWAIPIVTALIAGYLVWHTYTQRGPLIVIEFSEAEGLTPGQSQVRFRDVNVGTVQTVVLTEDLQRVRIGVRMTKESEPLLTEFARFWIVKPRLFAGNLSGLDTLLSGSYIGISPSAPGGEARRSFVGLQDPPLLAAEQPGRTFLVRADRLGSISLGSPVFFRDIEVGEVMGWDIATMAEHVTLHVFVRAPYDGYVREGSRFWNASGISVKLGAEGVQLQLESVRALLLGGIVFETPELARRGAPSPANEVFTLYASQEAANLAAPVRRVPVLSYFTESVSGLSPGAPVVFQGIRIGQVIGFDLEYDPETDHLRVPVRYEIEPGRIALSREAESRGPLENARLLVRQGLRARLASANLLTGQQQISLDIVQNAAPADVSLRDGSVVLPSAPGQFASIIDGVNQVVARIEGLPFQQIGENVNETVAGINALVRGPELREALASLQEVLANANAVIAGPDLRGSIAALQSTLEGVNRLVDGPEIRATLASLQATLAAAEDTAKRIDAAATPTLRALPQLVANLNAAVTQAGRLFASTSRGYGDESQFRRDLDRALEQITVAARSLRNLADTLNRNPESLVRGRATQAP